jgi:hypothetical protein
MSNLAALSVKSSSLKQELEQLFRENHRMLYQTAYSLLDNPADAEEVPQSDFPASAANRPACGPAEKSKGLSVPSGGKPVAECLAIAKAPPIDW